MIVELTEREARFGEAVGCLRHCNAVRRGRKRESGFPNNWDGSEFVEILGGQCEAAAHEFLKPVSWNWHQVERFSGLADLNGWIDVKGVAQRHHKLLVPCSPAPKAEFGYLLVDRITDKRYDLVGWMEGQHVLASRVTTPHREVEFPCYTVERRDLRDPHELFRWVRDSNRVTG